MVVKRLLSLLIVVIVLAGLASAQTFTKFNPPPCDFTDQFYADNGLVSCTPQSDGSCTRISGAELNSEPDGRFGDFRQTGPPATGTQQNWVNDTSCTPNDPTRRNVRILASTGGNADDGVSPFTCANQASFTGQPLDPVQQIKCNNVNTVPVTPEYISLIAFLHAQSAVFSNTYSRTVGTIGPNGGLDNQQTNAGTTISIGTFEGNTLAAANPRGITQEDIVGNFEAYGAIKQREANGTFDRNPCAADMQSPLAGATPCFSVADTFANNTTTSDVATPNLRQNWRFATNRNAMDGSDNNCVDLHDQNCKHGALSDSPFGYFCDDLLGMWIITYFWFTQDPTDPTQTPPGSTCDNAFKGIKASNGATTDNTPVILTAFELNDEIEGQNCGAEGQEAVDGTDGGAAWLVCPAIPDPRNGAIASDAFLDLTTHTSTIDTFISNNFSCLQTTGKFCFESSVE